MASFTNKGNLPIARLALGGVISVAWLCGTVRAEEMPCKVDWQRGVLTISADNVTRAACLQSLAQRIGIKMSGLENVRGSVTLTLSTPQVAEAIRKLAGDTSYTLIENDPDHAGDPRTQSVRFSGAGIGPGRTFKASRDIMRGEAVPVVMVENVDLGIMEARSLQPHVTSTAKGLNARPDPAGAPGVHVHIEN